MEFSPIILSSLSLLSLLFAAIVVPLVISSQRLLIAISFSLTAVASLLAVAAGCWVVGSGLINKLILPLGLPNLPFHLRLDPLSGFFLTVIGLLGFFVSIYSIGYVKGFLGKRSVTPLVIFYSLFMAGMFLVVLADDAFFFLISWEVMALASYFLVMFEDEKTENRRAAFLYLVVAHVGAIAILLSFGVMAGLATGFETFNGYTFDAMREAKFSSGWATVAFFLAFFGFAAKAGVVPLHVWLPEAHPVAPSNVSALMSGVMLKTAIYGIIRITFDLIHVFPWWWGAIVLFLGLISTVMGVLYALMQHDLKRLLAYHSVENIGIILIGIGLAMIFTSFNLPILAALALIAGLYHTLNHAMFKGLLFMGAGAVLHATKERNMEEMGGLIHKMPWTAALFLIGCISISALPPFNGFVSEWLTFQAFLLTPALPNALLNLLIPLGAALLALAAALAAACFVKAYGVTFLGHWRGHHNPPSAPPFMKGGKGGVEVDWFMRIGMILPAIACLGLGVFPTFFIQWMDIIPEQLLGSKIAASAGAFGWMWLTPVSHERASYSGFIVFLGILSVVAVVYLLLHTRRTAVRRAPIWDCGFGKLTNRMQYTATSFSMPIRRIFGFLFNIKEQVRITPPVPPFNKGGGGGLHYHLRVRDRFWNLFYQPVADASFWVSRQFGRLQQGRIHIYLVYSFITIIVLLVFLR
ncbi:MAG TPA: hydrogenase 4 subunit B [Deltaproteobacteria bacterium]|nr:MAG: hydrogenase 4 subunit B [Deltaproteobacteria bacterium GWB2_42_7]OGP42311.1 MAG: hydrogenase 4 subunit B [Deltaproteobacteria bacterium GWD2_42_10]HAG51584.1 hydrogenase 4 subunit B [Deltaproteobacteria bacterium]